MLRARAADVAPDLTGEEAVRCIIAIANLQRALREDSRNWAKMKQHKWQRGHGLELWKEPTFLYSLAQLEARVPSAVASIDKDNLVWLFRAYVETTMAHSTLNVLDGRQ